MNDDTTEAAPPLNVERLLRDLAPEVLGVVVRRSGRFDEAEDAVQEALLAAALQWPRQGVPETPRAWLIQVALRRMVDQARANHARRRRETTLAQEAEVEQIVPAPDSDSVIAHLDGTELDEGGDDTLRLLFMCSHPALTRPSAIALTLRAVGGLTTLEIARAFLVPEATMAQRISRAKQTIKKSGIGFDMPAESERAARLSAVLHALYLVFNEGYASSSGVELQRVELSSEAIRLARRVHRVLPEDPEATGLLALMLLTDARRLARSGPDGELIPLDEQDRSRWDRDAIDEGTALVTAALSRGRVGSYQLQAAIAAVHGAATDAAATDWAEIMGLYALLRRMSDNPMVILNHAIAVAMVHGPAAGLELLRPLDHDSRISETHRLDAVRGHLFEMAGHTAAAIAHYRAAAQRTASLPERNYLLRKAARLAETQR